MIALARKLCLALAVLSAGVILSSCASTITSALVTPALYNMQEQTDVLLVCEGTPSYLLMIDSLIAGDPNDQGLLILGTKAYAGYIGAMIECGEDSARIKAMADKAQGYSSRLLRETLTIQPTDNLETFTNKLERSSSSQARKLFWVAFGWISWLQQQEGSPAAMAGLGKLELLLQKIIELDEDVEDGMAHFLIASYYGARPGMLGGKPELSRYHFDRALQISERKILIVQTLYALTYARNTFNQELHDNLLQEVVDFPIESNKSYMLANQIAKKKAERLIQEKFFDD